MRNARWIILFSAFVFGVVGCSSFASQSRREGEQSSAPTSLNIKWVAVEGVEGLQPRIYANTAKGQSLCLYAPKGVKLAATDSLEGVERVILARHKHGEYRPTREMVAQGLVLGNFVDLPMPGLDRLPGVKETWAQLPGQVHRGLNGVLIVPTENGTKALLFLGLVSEQALWTALKSHYSALGVDMHHVPDTPPDTSAAASPATAAPEPATAPTSDEAALYH